MKLYEKSLEKIKITNKINKFVSLIFMIAIGVIIVSIMITLIFHYMGEPLFPNLLGKYYDLFSDIWRTTERSSSALMFMIVMLSNSICLCVVAVLIAAGVEIYKIFNIKYFKYSEQDIIDYLNFKKTGSKDKLNDKLRTDPDLIRFLLINKNK